MARQGKPLLRSKEQTKAMPLAEDMKNTVENMVSSYEAKIRSIGAIFDTTHQLLQSFQGSFLDTRQERERLKAELRENLAKNESLRKKDFDNIMQDILSTQERREQEVRNLLNSYLNEQKEMANILRNNLAKVKDALAEGEAQRVRELQAVMKRILAEQEKRKEKAIFKLEEFQKGQRDMLKALKELSTKGRELRLKDLKLMLKSFKVQHGERIPRQQEGKKEVQNMFDGIEKEPLEAAESGRTMQEKMAQRRSISPAAANTSV